MTDSDSTVTEPATPTAASTPAPDPQPAQAAPTEPVKADTDWKAEARKWEQRAKENRTVVEKLQTVFGVDPSEGEKPEDRLATLQQRVEQLQRTNEVNEIARTLGITDSDDIARLTRITDPELRADIAARLKPTTQQPAPVAAPQADPGQGARTSGSSEDDEYARYFPSSR
jgi:flagellar motility protein MotE (MotC chaperone)